MSLERQRCELGFPAEKLTEKARLSCEVGRLSLLKNSQRKDEMQIVDIIINIGLKLHDVDLVLYLQSNKRPFQE